MQATGRASPRPSPIEDRVMPMRVHHQNLSRCGGQRLDRVARLLGWVIVCASAALQGACSLVPLRDPMTSGDAQASGATGSGPGAGAGAGAPHEAAPHGRAARGRDPHGGGGGRITREELSQRLMAFADRYTSRISEATDKLKRDATDTEVRRAAHATKFFPASAILTFAAEPDPVAGMLDMLTVTTLERMVWQDTGWAVEVFGAEGAQVLRKAQVDAENDIWSCAAEVLPPERLRDVRQVIEDWQHAHPDNRYVSTMRFDDFAAGGGDLARRALASRAASGGFLAPINEATRAVDEMRLWGERFIFITGRMQRMMSWQAELLVYELTFTPEVKQALANHRAMSDAMQRFATSVAAWADVIARERAALVKDITEQTGATGELVTNFRAALTEAQPLAADVRRTSESAVLVTAELRGVLRDAKPLLEEVTRLSGKPPSAMPAGATPAGAPVVATAGPSPSAAPTDAAPTGATPTDAVPTDAVPVGVAPPTAALPASVPPAGAPAGAARPFDVREYESLVREMHALVDSTDALLASGAWQSRLNEVNTAAETQVAHAGRQGRELVDYWFYRGVFFAVFCAGLLFVTAMLYRLTVRRFFPLHTGRSN